MEEERRWKWIHPNYRKQPSEPIVRKEIYVPKKIKKKRIPQQIVEQRAALISKRDGARNQGGVE